MQQSNKRGRTIFGAIVLIVLVLCFIAYVETGSKGIEERFSNSVGLPSENGKEGGNSFLGFSVEGNNLLYISILVLILAATALISIKYRV